MIDVVYTIPSFFLFILVSSCCILLSFILTKFVHHHVPLKFRYEENQAIACVSALIGIIYAILIGFVVLYELGNFNKAGETEEIEAKALFSIFRVSRILPEPSNTKIRQLVVDYANNTINNEWPLMAQGKHVNKEGLQLIDSISHEIRSFKILEKANPLIVRALNEASINTSILFDSHEARVAKTFNSVSANIWFVLLLGSFLTIGINCMLGMEFRLHMICMVAISLMVGAVIYLIVTLDRPYRGDFSIQPNTIKSTLEYIEQKEY